MAPHSRTLAWKIPWTEEPGRLQSMGSLRVGHDWATSLSLFTFMQWRRKWQPTPVFLPGESQGRRSLVGCRLWGHTESDKTEATQQQQHIIILSLLNLPPTPPCHPLTSLWSTKLRSLCFTATFHYLFTQGGAIRQSQSHSPAPLCPNVPFLCLCLYSCPGNRFICIIFLDSKYMH